MSEYIVLQEAGEGWKLAGTVMAAGPYAALRKVVEVEGVYVAVPTRSWKPRRAGVVTKQELEFGDVG